jgi:hypothetical protein
MDLLWYYRYRRGGGESGFIDWEFRSAPTSWESAPAPAQVGRIIARTALGHDIPIEDAGPLTTVMHWGYGTSWGAVFGIARDVTENTPGPLAGLAFGTLVFGSDYVTLPLLGVYKPIWEYDATVLGDDLTAHLVFGVVTAMTTQLLGAGRDPV